MGVHNHPIFVKQHTCSTNARMWGPIPSSSAAFMTSGGRRYRNRALNLRNSPAVQSASSASIQASASSHTKVGSSNLVVLPVASLVVSGVCCWCCCCLFRLLRGGTPRASSALLPGGQSLTKPRHQPGKQLKRLPVAGCYSRWS